MGARMRSKVIIIISLALTLTGCNAQAEGRTEAPATEQASARDTSLDNVSFQFDFDQDTAGNPIIFTRVNVDGINVPGASENMQQPFLTSVFYNQALNLEELLVCDANAMDIEASCVAVPANQQATAAELLISIFDRAAGKALADYIEAIDNNEEVQPENFPRLQSPLGITNTT